MRKITLIVIHCSANREGSKLKCKDIDRMHRQKGWDGCGYHFVIPTDGSIEKGRSLFKPGAHCKEHNRHSIGICYIGGLSKDGKRAKDTRTMQQRQALDCLLQHLHRMFPDALIVGHHDLNPLKACPCFDAATEYGYLQPQ